MKLLIEETELKNLVYKAVRYDIIVDSLIREKFDKIDIYSDWETVESYMDDIMRQQPNNIKPTDELKKKYMTILLMMIIQLNLHIINK